MRRTKRFVPLILTCFMAGCATTQQESGGLTDATVIDLPGAVHFRTLEDADQTVEAGPYRVERADPGGRLQRGLSEPSDNLLAGGI